MLLRKCRLDDGQWIERNVGIQNSHQGTEQIYKIFIYQVGRRWLKQKEINQVMKQYFRKKGEQFWKQTQYKYHDKYTSSIWNNIFGQ